MIKHIRILPGGLAVLAAVLLCLLTAVRKAFVYFQYTHLRAALTSTNL